MEISKAAGDNDRLRTLMTEYASAQVIRNNIARELGNQIVT